MHLLLPLYMFNQCYCVPIGYYYNTINTIKLQDVLVPYLTFLGTRRRDIPSFYFDICGSDTGDLARTRMHMSDINFVNAKNMFFFSLQQTILNPTIRLNNYHDFHPEIIFGFSVIFTRDRSKNIFIFIFN